MIDPDASGKTMAAERTVLCEQNTGIIQRKDGWFWGLFNDALST
jgi:hypothetical protein